MEDNHGGFPGVSFSGGSRPEHAPRLKEREDTGLKMEGEVGGARPWERVWPGADLRALELSRDPTLMTGREEVRLGRGVYVVCRGGRGVERPEILAHSDAESSEEGSSGRTRFQKPRVLEVRGWALVGVHSQAAGPGECGLSWERTAGP